jgi:hypothetical protein
LSRALARRVAALEAARGASRPDHASEAMVEALAQLGLPDALATYRGGLSRTLADIHPDLPALHLRLWMERQGWAYYEEDVQL